LSIKSKHVRAAGIAFFAALFAWVIPVRSQTITVDGFWSLTLDVTMLQAGAGSDFIDPIQSATNQVLADIRPKTFGKTWIVYVHKTDILWDNSLHLDIRRQPYTNLLGGLSYFELTGSDQEFFYSDNRKRTDNVQIQFQLRGQSISLIPGTTYETTVVYTLVDS
jgi:hypothetical protein